MSLPATPKIIAIVAMGKNRAIGKNNQLLWRIPEDLKRFKEMTTGHPIIMGRKTFDSIGKPLPNRTNMVISRNTEWKHEGVSVFPSLEKALEAARKIDTEKVFIIGGAEIYTQSLALNVVDQLYVTLIDDSKDGDVFFPEFNAFGKELSRQEKSFGTLNYAWIILEK